MKQYLTVLYISMSLIFTPMVVSAQTDDVLRAQVQELLRQVEALSQKISQKQVVSLSFERNLSVGASGEDVKQLQVFLHEGEYYPEGLFTGYYGMLTRRAVERFQLAQGIVSGGTPETTGFGVLGPRTRAALTTVKTVIEPKIGGGEDTNKIIASGGVVTISDEVVSDISDTQEDVPDEIEVVEQTEVVDISADIDASVLSGDVAWQPVASFKLHAQYEDLLLTDMYLLNAANPLDVTEVSTQADALITSVGLFDESGKLLSRRSLVGGRVHFRLRDEMMVTVPRGDTARVYVYVTVRGVVSSLESGTRLRFALDTSKNDSGVVLQSTATGRDISMSDVVLISATSTASEFFVLRASKPVMTSVTPRISYLTNGSGRELYTVNISANQEGDIAWKGIKFDIDGRFSGIRFDGATEDAITAQGNVAISNIQLYDVDRGQEVAKGAYTVRYSYDMGMINAEVSIVLNNDSEEIILAGSSKTYQLRALISGVSKRGDMLEVGIDTETDRGEFVEYYVTGSPDSVDGSIDGVVDMHRGSSAHPYVLLWSDYSGVPHRGDVEIVDVKSHDWTNDYSVEKNVSPYVWVMR